MTTSRPWRLIGHTLLIAGATLATACARPQPDESVPPATSPEVDVAIPDADSLMPPLAAYATDDDAEPGEVRASLDHGSIPYDDVRRRLVVDENGFSLADVTVVTFRPGTDTAERVLAHTYGAARRDTVTIAGEEMLRIDTHPFATIAWLGDGFVVTFGRGQERSEAWLEELVRATVQGVQARLRGLRLATRDPIMKSYDVPLLEI